MTSMPLQSQEARTHGRLLLIISGRYRMLTRNGLNWGLLIAEVLTAAGTISLAFATFGMAKKTRDLADQSDRHHLEDLMPVCEFCVSPNRPRPVVESRQDRESYPPSFFEIRAPDNNSQGPVMIQNIGMGPALNVKVVVCLFNFPSTPFSVFVDDLRPGTACQVPRI